MITPAVQDRLENSESGDAKFHPANVPFHYDAECLFDEVHPTDITQGDIQVASPTETESCEDCSSRLDEKDPRILHHPKDLPQNGRITEVYSYQTN